MKDIHSENSMREAVSWLPEPIIFSNDEIDCMMLLKAYCHANETSPDPSTKNGAVLLNVHKHVLTFGVNRFPKGVAETEKRLLDKETKYRLVVHAESSAIFNAARHGKMTNGSTLYCPFYACSECAKAIIQSGVKRVVGHATIMALASEHTTWVQSIIDSWEVLHESGVECVLYDGIIGVTTRFNGKDILV